LSLRGFLLPLMLLAGATVAALSCGDTAPLGVGVPTPAGLAAGLKPHSGDDDSDDSDDSDNEDKDEDGDSLVPCRPLPYDSVTQTIGPEGGEVEVGRNWLVIPRGALRNPVRITAVAPSDTLAVVRFQPEGLVFQSTALVVLAYDNCRVPRSATPRIALVTDALAVVEYLASGTPPGYRWPVKGHKGPWHVIGQLQHFSNYAVAW
jgi:hypothetical protein